MGSRKTYRGNGRNCCRILPSQCQSNSKGTTPRLCSWALLISLVTGLLKHTYFPALHFPVSPATRLQIRARCYFACEIEFSWGFWDSLRNLGTNKRLLVFWRTKRASVPRKAAIIETVKSATLLIKMVWKEEDLNFFGNKQQFLTVRSRKGLSLQWILKIRPLFRWRRAWNSNMFHLQLICPISSLHWSAFAFLFQQIISNANMLC